MLQFIQHFKVFSSRKVFRSSLLLDKEIPWSICILISVHYRVEYKAHIKVIDTEADSERESSCARACSPRRTNPDQTSSFKIT